MARHEFARDDFGTYRTPEQAAELDRQRELAQGAKEPAPAFTVKTNHGFGWRVPEAPECPSWATQEEAQAYADLRNIGFSHEKAWETITGP